MTLDPSTDEVLIIEEQVATEPRPESSRTPPARIAGIVLGSVGLGLAATTITWRLVNRRRSVRGRRRGSWLTMQPRIGVFAPSLTISLPFSSITGQQPSGRARAGGKRQRGLVRSAGRQRMGPLSGRPGRRRRSARPVASR